MRIRINLCFGNQKKSERRILMKDPLNGLIEAIGGMAEMVALIRDSLLKNGFTREEAVSMAGECLTAIILNAGGKK
jgi:hypothetical protein